MTKRKHPGPPPPTTVERIAAILAQADEPLTTGDLRDRLTGDKRCLSAVRHAADTLCKRGLARAVGITEPESGQWPSRLYVAAEPGDQDGTPARGPLVAPHLRPPDLLHAAWWPRGGNGAENRA